MSKRKQPKDNTLPHRGSLGTLAEQFAEALAENELHMGEMAAFAVTCEQFGIDEDEGYDLLAEMAKS
jgi:thymidine phosphorylase